MNHRSLESRTLRATLVNGLSFLIALAQTIILVPILLFFWGKEQYGIWLSISALYSLLQTFNSSHQTYITNEFCKTYSTDAPKFKITLASAIWIDISITSIPFLFMAGVIYFNLLSPILGLNQFLIEKYRLDIGIGTIAITWFLCSCLTGISGSIYPAAGLLSRSLWWGIWTRLGQVIAVVATAMMGGNILNACIWSSIMVMILSLLLFKDTYHCFTPLYPFWHGGDWKIGLLNFRNSIVLTGASILLQVKNSVLILQIAAVLGTATLPVFTTIQTVGNTFIQATNIISQPLMPEMIRYHAQGEKDKLVGIISASWFTGGILINLGLIASLPFIENAYMVWTRGRIEFDWLLYLLIALSISLKNFGIPLTYYLIGINHLRFQMITSIAQASVVIISTIFFLRPYGLVAAGIALAFAELISSVILPIVIVINEIKFMGGIFPRKNALLALASVCIVGLDFLVTAFRLTTPAIATFVNIMFLFCIYFLQWVNLPTEVQKRIKEMTFRILRLKQ